MIIFGRPISPDEILMGILSVVSLALGVIGNITGTALKPTIIALGGMAGALLLAFIVGLTRQTYVIVGYRSTMTLLERLAKSAQRSLWTARSHQGAVGHEQQYFKIIQQRLMAMKNPLEDFRRTVRVGAQEATTEDLKWLVENLSNLLAVHISVAGVEDVFDALYIVSTLFFDGKPGRPEKERAELLAKADTVLISYRSSSKHPAG
jgi:hypothetical protein